MWGDVELEVRNMCIYVYPTSVASVADRILMGITVLLVSISLPICVSGGKARAWKVSGFRAAFIQNVSGFISPLPCSVLFLCLVLCWSGPPSVSLLSFTSLSLLCLLATLPYPSLVFSRLLSGARTSRTAPCPGRAPQVPRCGGGWGAC